MSKKLMMSKKLTKRQSVIALAVVVALVVLVVGLVMKNASTSVNQAQQAVDSYGGGNTPTTSEPTNLLKNAVLYDASKDAVYKTQILHINSATASDVISNPILKQSKVADPNVKFLVINATITNTTSVPITFASYALLDDKGNTLNDALENSDGFTLLLALENYLFQRTLNPNVPETGDMLFKIPAGLHSGAIVGINNSTGKVTGIKISF